jgi:uncharacterized protein (DUF488 family)
MNKQGTCSLVLFPHNMLNAMDEKDFPSEIWTIGHSNRELEDFMEILRSFKIELVADVRSLPGSSRFPHFNKESLEMSLKEHSIEYVHIPELGGRRKVNKDTKNTAWKNKSFRGYADYMDTEDFEDGIKVLLDHSQKRRTVLMCAEGLWWRCHRSMISDYLKSIGINVNHIMDNSKYNEHSYTSPAKFVNGKLTYHE